MAIQHIIEKLTGTSQSLSLPIFVYEDSTPPLEIDENDVVAYLDAQSGVTIPEVVLGVPDDGDPGLERLSYSAWRATIKYRIPSLRPLHPPFVGEERSGFNFHLPRKFLRWAPQVGKFPSTAMDQNGFIHVDNRGQILGAWLEPPAPNLTKSLAVAPSAVTGAWVRGIAEIVGGGYVNSVPLTSGAYAAGEVIITHIIGSQTNDDLFHIDIGWNWTKNVADESRGTITGIDYDGQDYVWEYAKVAVDTLAAMTGAALKAVYVNQVRPRADLSVIGILPP